jgi:LmbE family N-acetylglucosaminyl deacetylase
MKSRFYLILVAILALIGCPQKPSIEELEKLAAIESYPADTYLDTVSNKKALVIIAHDDDDCTMSGTIFKLKKSGWKVEQWSLTTFPLAKGRTVHPSNIICNGNHSILEDGKYRNKNPYDSTLALYMPVPRINFDTIYETEKVSNALIAKINYYQPSVIFTLDNEIGGYGHPDHVFLYQLVLDLFNSGKISAQRLYQGVYTDHMEKEIIDNRLAKLNEKWGNQSAFLLARKIYGVEGMPEPDVEINIQDYADGKMEYLRAYIEEAKNSMRKFIPYYEDFDAKTYFDVFTKEYFKVYEKQ